jgi:hypothetical protein
MVTRLIVSGGEQYERNDFVLTAKHDPCAARRRLLEGVWESQGD